MDGGIGVGLLALGVGLGLKHGIDWDHIAAITDITGAQPSRKRGFAMGTLYALGHASVVLVLGLLALWVASMLPESMDAVMERIVGVTLLTLAAWVFWSLFHNPEQFVLRSRWMLLFAGVRSAYRWVMSRMTGRVYPASEVPRAYGAMLSFGIGMIHGIGAETGSQALLFASVAGATTAAAGSALLVAFVLGLIASNSLITLGSTMGVLGAQSGRKTYMAVGVIIGVFSLVVGTFFVFGRGDLLPGFFA